MSMSCLSVFVIIIFLSQSLFWFVFNGCFFFFQAEDGIRDVERSRGLGDVYKRQVSTQSTWEGQTAAQRFCGAKASEFLTSGASASPVEEGYEYGCQGSNINYRRVFNPSSVYDEEEKYSAAPIQYPSAKANLDRINSKYAPEPRAMSNLASLGKKAMTPLGEQYGSCLLYTSPSPRDLSTSRMPSSA
eukprot:TRINITY_DN1927_c0_g1_i13.p1 TRINITY_DN1927_c0_g1~~TRINITY_DN1927_c0_g1_i13.p1  ORF type:complete len:188 (-),score=42.64 TRINITY_DN1927_c0_g1_i13:139-702(-)